MIKSILGLANLGDFLREFSTKNDANFNDLDFELKEKMLQAHRENPWFTLKFQTWAFKNWAELLTEEKLSAWLSHYSFQNKGKKVGLILAGNIPLVGFHDIISVILSGNFAQIKCSSKDKVIIPFLLKIWQKFSGETLAFEIVEKLENFDAVIATGSNNTARYLEYYFKDYKKIIRKNRTSIAILDGTETHAELKLLANDIFTYFGLGCRNVTKLFISKDFPLERLFQNFMAYSDIINHHKYANNYDYNKAIYLLNQEKFWDNNFVMLKEDEALFSPLSVINFSRYVNLESVENFVRAENDNIQCIVGKNQYNFKTISFGSAQQPALDSYADDIDTLKFLQTL